MATKIVRSAVDRQHAYFGVHTDLRPIAKYRWQKDGLDIPGAGSNAAYVTPPLRTEDFKSKWRCIVYAFNGANEMSEEVGLTDPVPMPAPAPEPEPPTVDVPTPEPPAEEPKKNEPEKEGMDQ